MARTNTLSNYLTDIGNAIREKTGETEPIKATEFDTKINEIDTGINIDGIIKEYEVASGGNVNAGDFVKYVNDINAIKGNDITIDVTSDCAQALSATVLSSNKVFIAHRGTSSRLFAIVCEISGSTITKGVDTQLYSESNTAYTTSVVTLTESRVFIAHNYSSRFY